MDESKNCNNIEQLSALAEKIFSEMGFHRWAYQTQSEDLLTEAEPVLMHNFPKEWQDYYMGQNCSEIDPVITKGTKYTQPFQWSKLFEQQVFNQAEKNYIADAREHGMVDGLAVPIPSPLGHASVVSMVSEEKDADTPFKNEEIRGELIGISCAFHSMAKDYMRYGQKVLMADNPLTPREQECLLWTARGKTAWEISSIINITERTVTFHIENAKRKLDVTSKSLLVVKAILKGLIHP